MCRFSALFLACSLLAGGALAAVTGPLASLEPGLWSVSRSATGNRAVTLCVRDFVELSQWEHRGRSCSRSIISQTASETVVGYTCPGGEFGQARLTALTPRSLKIETQGIRAGEPFHYALFARKSGTCIDH
jgi:hypothetical protein